MEGRLTHASEELNQAEELLVQAQKLATLGELVSTIGHEINNPIGVIKNKVQILRYRVEDGEERDKLLAELNVVEKHTRYRRNFRLGDLIKMRPSRLGRCSRLLARPRQM